MNLLQMSIAAAVMIIVIILLRAAAAEKLPKRTFPALWFVVLLRLILPFQLPSPVSAYNFIPEFQTAAAPFTGTDYAPAEIGRPAAGAPDASGESNLNAPVTGLPKPSDSLVSDAPASGKAASSTLPTFLRTVSFSGSAKFIWLAGAVFFAACLLFSYVRCRRRFAESLPVKNPYVENWLKRRPLWRTVSIRVSSRIQAPLTYKILRPVILLPKTTDWENTPALDYILEHEFIHIRRLDAAAKLLFAAALCLHWFNPFVWIMFLLANRDIELACDEGVIRSFGLNDRSAYALTLIGMAEQNGAAFPLVNSFNKDASEERIHAIMKMKRISITAVFAAVITVAGVTAVFATSAAQKKPEPADIKPYDAGEVSDVAEPYDTGEPSDIGNPYDVREPYPEAFPYDGDEAYLKAHQEYVQASLLSPFTPYLPFGLTYEFTGGIENEDYDIKLYFDGSEARGIWDPAENIWITAHAGNTAYSEGAAELIAVYENGTLTGLRKATPEEQSEWDDRRNTRESAGTEEDYRSLLTLMTKGYRDQSVADFNNDLLGWCNEHFDASERISRDAAFQDFRVSLTPEELAFVNVTYRLSVTENTELIRSERTGNPKRDPGVGEINLYQVPEDSAGLLWFRLYYQFSYHLQDDAILTVGERDDCIGNFMNEIQEFWEETDSKTLLSMSSDDVVEKLGQIAARSSTEQITITLPKERCGFEAMDERKQEE